MTDSSACNAKDILSIIVFPGGFNWPLYVAEAKGFFAQENLEVRLTPTPNSVVQMSSLIKGEHDVAMTAFDNVVAYDEGQGEAEIDRQADIIAVSGGDRGFLTLTTLPEIARFSDLKGRELAVDALTTGYAFVLLEMLSRNGLGPEDVTFGRHGGALERWKGLLERRFAGTLLVTPFDIMAEDKGFKRLATARSVLGAYQGVVVAVNREKARANADKLIRFIRAQIAGVEWLYAAQNRAEAITILRHNVPQLDEDVANRSYATMIAANTGFQRAAEVEMDGVRTVLALRSKYGRPQKTLTDLTRYLDLSFHERAQEHKNPGGGFPKGA